MSMQNELPGLVPAIPDTRIAGVTIVVRNLFEIAAHGIPLLLHFKQYQGCLKKSSAFMHCGFRRPVLIVHDLKGECHSRVTGTRIG